MSVGWYNGWSGAQRRASLPLQRAAIREGLIPKPTMCSICGFQEGDDPTGRNTVTWHTENYGDLLDAYPICRTDHAILHRRFERRKVWLRLIAKYGDGSKWFERLSLDPSSQWRPFIQTYPDGVEPP